MKRILGFLVVVGVLAGLLTGCRSTSTPEATEPPPTQTPWIVVVTATPGPETVAEARPTQTPWIVVVTPTRTRQAKPTPTNTREGAAPTGEAGAPTREATSEPTQAVEATPIETSQAPSPTTTPESASLKYAAPLLLDPPSEGRVLWKDRPLLKWEPVGELAEDEYYALQFDRPPKTADMLPYGDYVYVKDSEFLWEGSAKAPFHPPSVQGEATVFWWVRVVRKTGENDSGKPLGVDISPPSDRWSLILDPKPDDA